MSTNGEVKRIGFKQFCTGHFTQREPAYLSEEEFALVLDGFVVGFVNYILLNQEKRLTKMLLVKRFTEPWPDWWLPGGRMVPGESFEETAIRYLKTQLGLTIDDRSRFQRLGTYAFIWAKRSLPPTGHGCHIVSMILLLNLKSEEAKQIRLIGDIYSELSWVRPEVVAIQTGLHQGLAECIRDLIEFLRIKSG